MEFPIELPWSFGDPPLLGLEHLEGDSEATLSLERRADACEEALSLLLGQFDDAGPGSPRRAPRLRAILCTLAAGVQDVENAIWQLYTERSISVGVGSQLDLLGLIVRQPRAGRRDETYRAFLRARVLVYRSDGSSTALLRVLRALGFELERVRSAPRYPAGWCVDLGQFLDDVSGVDAFDLLHDAKAAGVRLRVKFPGAPVEDSFTLSATDARVVDERRGFGSVLDPVVGGVWAGVIAEPREA